MTLSRDRSLCIQTWPFCKQSLISDRLDSVYTGENSLSEGGGSVKGGEGGGAEYVETASWDPFP